MKLAQAIVTYDDLSEHLGLAEGIEISQVIVDPLYRTVCVVLTGEADDLFVEIQPGLEPYVHHLSRFQGDNHGRTVHRR